MTRKLVLLGTVIATLGFLSPAYAEVWTFNSPTGDLLSNTHNYTGTAGTILTATGFGPGNPNLFGKNDGVDENGLGLTNDASGQHEITPGSFIQVGLAPINFMNVSLNMSFQGLSTTNGETWQVWGTNTAGTLAGATLLASCTASGGSGNACEQVVTVNGLGAFLFADITAFGTGSNVLLSELNTSAVPLPGALPLFATGLGALGLLGWRRKKKAAAFAA